MIQGVINMFDNTRGAAQAHIDWISQGGPKTGARVILSWKFWPKISLFDYVHFLATTEELLWSSHKWRTMVVPNLLSIALLSSVGQMLVWKIYGILWGSEKGIKSTENVIKIIENFKIC